MPTNPPVWKRPFSEIRSSALVSPASPLIGVPPRKSAEMLSKAKTERIPEMPISRAPIGSSGPKVVRMSLLRREAAV